MNMKITTRVISALALFALTACGSQNEAYVWTPAGDHIRTEWAETIDPSAVLQEYPRPQMVRSDWKNLNGLWDYAIIAPENDPQGTACLTEASQGKILVPFCVESALSGVGRFPSPDSLLLYRTEFKLPKWTGDRVLLHFGAVDQNADVYVNGKQLRLENIIRQKQERQKLTDRQVNSRKIILRKYSIILL